MQEWFNTHKKASREKHMIISIDAEKLFVKVQQPLTILLRRLGRELLQVFRAFHKMESYGKFRSTVSFFTCIIPESSQCGQENASLISIVLYRSTAPTPILYQKIPGRCELLSVRKARSCSSCG